MNFIWNIIIFLLMFNTIGAIITVFNEDRPVTSIWSWLLVLILFPGIGFIAYFFIGRRISNKRIYMLDETAKMGIDRTKKKYLDDDGDQIYRQDYSDSEKQLIELLGQNGRCILTDNNSYDLYFDGNEFMNHLLEDLKKAKHHISFQFYIFESDELGEKFIKVLEEKAKEGVHVRFLYDVVGARKMDKADMKRLKDAGAEVVSFLGYSHWIQNMRLNFRNHRKQVVIDGKVGYIGGYNISTEYIGQRDLGYWRDTHMRVEGDIVQGIQEVFIKDWCASRRIYYKDFLKEFGSEESTEAYFPLQETENHVPMQIVPSGPEHDLQQIEMGYTKMITMAKKSIFIQTPYFIPSEAAFESLKYAAMSGVDVRIMIPCKPDHPFVYRATEYYCREAIKYGIRVYKYDNGFIHAKVVGIDDEVVSMGTANFDIRSFQLNFEVNNFIYDDTFAKQMHEQFDKDILKSTELSRAYFNDQSLWKKFRQNFSRLLSPIL